MSSDEGLKLIVKSGQCYRSAQEQPIRALDENKAGESAIDSPAYQGAGDRIRTGDVQLGKLAFYP